MGCWRFAVFQANARKNKQPFGLSLAKGQDLQLRQAQPERKFFAKSLFLMSSCL